MATSKKTAKSVAHAMLLGKTGLSKRGSYFFRSYFALKEGLNVVFDTLMNTRTSFVCSRALKAEFEPESKLEFKA